MSKYEVVEKFVSINGEGTKAGQLAVFIRFKGCNLNCKYCDTKWANEQETPSQPMTEKEILDYVLSTGVKNVTLTGGEPLLREGIENVIPLSDFRFSDFDESYGVRMADGPLAGLLARAVVVIGKDGKIAYTELVPEITQEPDYDKALAAVK